MKRLTALFTIMLFAVLFAQSGNSGDGSNALNLEKPAETQCGTSGNFVDFSCNIMKALLKLGPIVAVIALIAGGAIYIYAQMFVTADQRGRYQSLAVNLVVGALLLAALVGGAGLLVSSGMKFLSAG